MPKKQFSIILFLIIGLLLRLISINQSLWLDEAISVELVKKPFFLTHIYQFMQGDYNPPLFNIILHFWLKIFPAQEFFIRLPSLIFGLATGLYLYKIAQLFFNSKKRSYFTLILLMTSPLHIYYSQEARMYSLAALTTTSSMYYFIKFWQSKNSLNNKYFILYVLATALTLYSHYLSWLILPVQWAYIIWQKNKKVFLNFLMANIFIAFSLIPLMPLLLNQLQTGKKAALANVVWGDVVGELSFKNMALLPIKFMIGRTSFDNKLLYYSIVLLLLMFSGFLLTRARKKAPLFWLWLIIPPILGAGISFKIPVFSYFRFLFVLPAFYLLLASGVFNFKNPKPYLIFLLTVNLFFSFRYLLNPKFHRENWQGAVRTLLLKNRENAPVLIEQNVAAPFNFYDKQRSRTVYVYQKETIANFDSVWLIPYALPIFDPQDETRSFLENRGFVRVYEEHFRGVTLEKWQKLMAGGYNLDK